MTREIKSIGKYQYVYESSMVWDHNHEKRHKVSKYVGKMVDGKPVKIREAVSVKGVYEIGHIELVYSLMQDVLSLLRKEFPDDHDAITAMFLNRAIYPMPLKSVKAWVEKTYLARSIEEISRKSLSAMLGRIGSQHAKQKSMFQSLMKKNEIIAYDTSALFTYSKGISMAEFGHNNNDITLPQIKIILGFSRSRNEPCYIRSDPGSIADIETLKTSQKEVPPGTLFVMVRVFI